MRILLASREFQPDTRSGAARLAGSLWQRLRDHHQVQLVAGWRSDPSLLPASARVVKISEQSRLRSRGMLELVVRAAALSFQPEVVVGLGTEIPSGLAPTVGLLGDPFAGASSWGRLRALRNRVVRTRVLRMSAPVAPSETVRRRYGDIGLDTRRIRVIWPGVDTGAFRPDRDVPALPTQRQGPIKLLYVARMIPNKAQHVAVEAVKGLPERLRKRIRLDLVGPIDDPTYHASLVRRALGAPVYFHPEVPDVVPFMRQAHVILYTPAREEPFAYAAIEGLACGKPVIYSSFAGLCELMDGRGLPVPAGDVGQLAAALRALLTDRKRCADLGRAGREICVDRYSAELALSAYEALIEEVACDR